MKELDAASKKSLQILYKMGYANIPNLPLDTVRKIFSSTFQANPPDKTIHTEHNGKPLPLHMYYPPSKKAETIILYFHGGGYVIRQFSQSARICRQLANEMNASVTLVEYSLSPESKFPTAIEEAAFAIDWATENKELLYGQKNTPIFLYGESSGGNLSTAVLLYHENANVQGNILVCPSLDYCHTYESKHELYAKGYTLDDDVRLWFANHYLNNDDERENPLVTFILSDKLKILPRTLIIAAHFDPLRDEARAFYEALYEKGVSVEFGEFDTVHGFLSLRIKPYNNQAWDDIRTFVK